MQLLIWQVDFKGKQEKAVAKQKLEVAKIEAQVQKVTQDGAWEETAIKASDNSSKMNLDVFTLLDLIGAYFIPAAQPYIEDGFRCGCSLREDCTRLVVMGNLGINRFQMHRVRSRAKMLRPKSK